MSPSILWYVHDHGLGHLRRAMAVVPHLTSQVVVAAGPGVSPAAARTGIPTVCLPSDVDEVVGPTVGPWHHAPAGPAVRARALAIADTVERFGCTTAVVDVSAEVTALCRLLGLRVVSVRQSGHRGDAAHRLAHATADVVWVPQHRALEPTGDEAVDERWCFSGAFSRFDIRASVRSTTRPTDNRRVAVLLVGQGGHTLDSNAWSSARVPDGWRVQVVGVDHPSGTGDGGVEFHGRVDDVGPILGAADVVVTSAGWASVADAVACGARLALIAEQRPFDEQRVRAERLATLGLAVHLRGWPSPTGLGAVIDQVIALPPDGWARYHDGSGAQRAATMIERCHHS